jgi:hypothetical protein
MVVILSRKLDVVPNLTCLIALSAQYYVFNPYKAARSAGVHSHVQALSRFSSCLDLE